MMSSNFGQFLTPPPPIVTRFITKAFVTESTTPSPLDRDVIYGRPLCLNLKKCLILDVGEASRQLQIGIKFGHQTSDQIRFRILQMYFQEFAGRNGRNNYALRFVIFHCRPILP